VPDWSFVDAEKVVQRAKWLRRARGPDGCRDTRCLRRGIIGLRRALAGRLLLEEVGDICLSGAQSLTDLDQCSLVQLELVAVLDFLGRPPVMITDIVPLFVVYHNPLVKGMVLEVSILPPFGLAAQVVCV